MTSVPVVSDLIILVADRNMEASLAGILNRRKSFHITTELRFEISRHPEKDCGCRLRSHEFLSTFQRQFRFALVVFDREGCGSSDSRQSLEEQVERHLAHHGWEARSAAIVIEPELEAWVWSSSPHVAEELGWNDDSIAMRDWMQKQGYLGAGELKPTRPKESMEKILRRMKKPRSSSIYQALASKVGFAGCRDPAFLKLKAVLTKWFAN
jgi:hypothetical protein